MWPDVHGAAGRCGPRSKIFLGEQGLGAESERRAQLLRVEVGQRARLGKNEVGDVALAGNDFLDPFVNRPRTDQPVRHHRAGLFLQGARVWKQ